jgi:hypothetical protein
MATPPDEVRTGLTLVTTTATAEVVSITATAPSEPEVVRAVLFDAIPLLVGSYADGSSALALDWYEELREESPATTVFTPSPVALVRNDHLAKTVAWATEPLRDLEADLRDLEAQMAQAIDDSLERLLPEIQREVAAAFWDTMTENVESDPDAVGWRRFSRPGACPFCRMLADKGAVYSSTTATFAAHTTCHCVAAPVFDGEPGEEAGAMQYIASQKRRSAADKSRLREYLKANYGA